MKTAVLITIGDEILSGNTVDTNSNFIATQLKEIGIKVLSIFTIPDEESAIVATLGRAFEMSDVVFTTGGLGPTKDDITKKAYADFFEDEMIFSDEIYEHLRAYLEKRNRLWILEHNKDQAMVLSKAKIFLNYFGTAPCMIMEKDGPYCFSLPGVPYEVKPLVKDQIIPFLKEKLSLDHIVTRIVSVVDIPESILSETIEEWELALPKHISLSYLPVGTRVKLRLTASGSAKDLLDEELENEIQKLIPIIGENIIATHEDKIEKIGIEKSKESFNRADLIILIVDGSCPLTEEDEKIIEKIGSRNVLVLINKTDLGQIIDEEDIRNRLPVATLIKAAIKQNVGIQALEQEIENLVYGGKVKQEESLLVTNVRHMELLDKSKEAITDAYKMAATSEALDFIEVDVRRCWELLGEIIGESVTEDIIEQVFARFCLGK